MRVAFGLSRCHRCPLASAHSSIAANSKISFGHIEETGIRTYRQRIKQRVAWLRHSGDPGHSRFVSVLFRPRVPRPELPLAFCDWQIEWCMAKASLADEFLGQIPGALHNRETLYWGFTWVVPRMAGAWAHRAPCALREASCSLESLAHMPLDAAASPARQTKSTKRLGCVSLAP